MPCCCHISSSNRTSSEKAGISHKAGRHFVSSFIVKKGKSLVIRQGVVFQYICCNLYEAGECLIVHCQNFR